MHRNPIDPQQRQTLSALINNEAKEIIVDSIIESNFYEGFVNICYFLLRGFWLFMPVLIAVYFFLGTYIALSTESILCIILYFPFLSEKLNNAHSR